MTLAGTINSLASDFDLVVLRRTTGSQDADGVWQPGPPISLIMEFASIQPATGMERVVGGRDMRSDQQGQQVQDARVVYSEFELKTREPGFEPDQVLYDGGIWIVIRSEPWKLRDELIFRSLMTRETRGAS